MKRLGIALFAVGLASFAHAADLPTTKAPAEAKPNCWASFWTWLNSSASDCPLSAYGITLYGTLDLNATYLNEASTGARPPTRSITAFKRNAYESKLLAGYNGLSTSVIGLKMKEDLARVGLPGWSLIGVLEAGVNPYSGMFFNGPARWPTTTRGRSAPFRFRTRTSTAAAQASGTTRKATLASATRSTAR